MPAVVITPRLLYKEDFDTALQPGGTATVTVAGQGATTVHKVDAIFMSDLNTALNDAGAAAAGVPTGAIYWNWTTGRVHTRLT